MRAHDLQLGDQRELRAGSATSELERGAQARKAGAQDEHVMNERFRKSCPYWRSERQRGRASIPAAKERSPRGAKYSRRWIESRPSRWCSPPDARQPRLLFARQAGGTVIVGELDEPRR
jgi:hypothetical protein